MFAKLLCIKYQLAFNINSKESKRFMSQKQIKLTQTIEFKQE